MADQTLAKVDTVNRQSLKNRGGGGGGGGQTSGVTVCVRLAAMASRPALFDEARTTAPTANRPDMTGPLCIVSYYT